MTGHTVLIIITCILSVSFVLEQWLNILNARYRPNLPDLVKDIYNEKEYERSLNYRLENTRLHAVKSTFNYIIMMILLWSGAFAGLDQWTQSVAHEEIFSVPLFFGVLLLGSDLLNLPFSLYSTFVIEQRYGFNKTTPATFISDKIKGYLLAIFLGGSLLALFVIYYAAAGQNFWIYAWITFSIVTILASMFYASVILPLFNKLTPLPEGDLRTEIEAYCRRENFPLSNLYVMNGSKRSSRANAFFSGLGRQKKIVLFDTLIEKHTNDELVAVLAHEIGHYKKKHVRTSVILGVAQLGFMLYLLSWFIQEPAVSQAFGSETTSFVLGLLGFSILYSPVSLIISIGMHLISRKNEFEADSFAASTYGAAPLQTALKKLHADSLSNVTPHPLYVFFYYSHPPLVQRLTALNRSAAPASR